MYLLLMRSRCWLYLVFLQHNELWPWFWPYAESHKPSGQIPESGCALYFSAAVPCSSTSGVKNTEGVVIMGWGQPHVLLYIFQLSCPYSPTWVIWSWHLVIDCWLLTKLIYLENMFPLNMLSFIQPVLGEMSLDIWNRVSILKAIVMLRNRNRVFEEVTTTLGRFTSEKQNSMHFGHEIFPYADIFVIEKLPSMFPYSLMGTVSSLCRHTYYAYFKVDTLCFRSALMLLETVLLQHS